MNGSDTPAMVPEVNGAPPVVLPEALQEEGYDDAEPWDDTPLAEPVSKGGFRGSLAGYPKRCLFCGFVAETPGVAGGHRNSKPKGKHVFEPMGADGAGGLPEKTTGKAQFFLPVALRSRSPAAIELAGKHVMLYEWLFKPHGVSLSDFVWECIEDVFASRGIDIGIILREDGQNGHGSGQIDDRPDFRAEENRVPAG